MLYPKHVLLTTTAKLQSTAADGSHRRCLLTRKGCTKRVNECALLLVHILLAHARASRPTPQVYNRVVALAWLHLLAAMALAIMAGVAGMGFEWAPQFASSQGVGVPLAAVCFFKVKRTEKRGQIDRQTDRQK